MKNTVVLSILCLVILTFTFSCNQKVAEWKGTIEEKEGVIIVENPKEPIFRNDIFGLEEDLSIGEVEGSEEYMFSNLSSIDVDDDENIYLFDSRQAKIKVFDKSGNFKREIGKRGQGPGEFTFPWGMTISHKFGIVVFDLIYRRMIIFSLSGEHQIDVPTWKQGGLLNMKLDSIGNIVGEVSIPGEKRIYALKKFNIDFEPIFTITSFERVKIPLLESISPKYHYCITGNDEIIWGHSGNYIINVHSFDGKLIKKITNDFELIKINEEEYREQVERKFGGKPIPPEFEQELPIYYPAFKSLSVDENGRLFVGTFQKISEGKERYYDVFNSDGKYIAKISPRAAPRVWKKGKLYTIEEDEEGFQVVKRYKVTWNY